MPPGWATEPAVGTATIGGDATAAIAFTIRLPADEPPGRRVLPADLTLGERRYGQRAEAIVDIVAGA